MSAEQIDHADSAPSPEARRDPRLPFEPATGESLPPRAQPGYYPGFSTLKQRDAWDEVTRKVVLDRVERPPEVRFFDEQELPLITAVCDRLLPQDDRDDAHKIPLARYIDDRLASGRIDGYRFDDMPPDALAIRLGLRGIDSIAQHLYGAPFVDLGPKEQDEVLLTIHDGKPPAGDEAWHQMPPPRFWSLLMSDVVEAYYAHPYAWDEIGFGGPAYPRGYMRLERGEPEPWEVRERRYEWSPPPESISGEPRAGRPAGGRHTHREPPHGQAGTH